MAGQARSYNPPGSEMSPTHAEQRSFSLDDRLLTPESRMDQKSESNCTSGMKQVQEFEDFNNRFASMLAEQSPSCPTNQQMAFRTEMNYTQSYQPISSVADFNAGPPKEMAHFAGYHSVQRAVPYPTGPVAYYEPSRSLTVSDYNRRGTAHNPRSTAVSWTPGLQNNSLPQHSKTAGSSPLQATSRTQLKQQLMRQQLHQEEEKARQNFSQSFHEPPPHGMVPRPEASQYPRQPIQRPPHDQERQTASLPHKSPINIPGQGTPVIALGDIKAKSKLENPTEYHVVESQKRKIRSKHFNEMDPASSEGGSGPPRSCVSLTGGSSTYEGSKLSDHQWGSSDPTQASMNKIFRSLPEIEIKTSEEDGSCLSYIDNNLKGYSGSSRRPSRDRLVYVGGPSSISDSPGVSSVSASVNSENSDIHLIEDQDKIQHDKGTEENDAHSILKEFMKFDDNIKLSGSPQSRNLLQHEQSIMQESSNSFGGHRTPTNTPQMPQIKTEPQQGHVQIDAYLKERKKKDSHNQIERSRRYNINARIEELCDLLPKNNDPYYSSVFMRRQYKGHILKATVDYIKVLKHSHDHYKQEEHRRRNLEIENRALLERLNELETRMRERGIDIQPSQTDKRLLHPNLLSSDVISSTTVSQHTSFAPMVNHSPTPAETACQPLFSQGTFPFGTDDSMLENVLSPPHETHPPTNDSCNTQETQKVRPVSPASEMLFGSESSVASLLYDAMGLRPEMDFFYPDADSPFTKEILDQIDFDVMDDEGGFVSDPLFSSPQVSSPNSSRQSLDDALNSDLMDVPS